MKIGKHRPGSEVLLFSAGALVGAGVASLYALRDKVFGTCQKTKAIPEEDKVLVND